MPRKAKDEQVIEDKKKTKKTTGVKAKATGTKKSSKKTITKKADVTNTPKKVATKTAVKKVSKNSKKDISVKDKKQPKASSSKKNNKISSTKSLIEKIIAKKTATKKEIAKKGSTEKNKKASTKKINSKKTKVNDTPKKVVAKRSPKKTVAKKSSKITKKPEIIEYYDLPYKYNKTVVKLLAQTPTTLFVYWEISNKDKDEFIKNYGEYFFNNTKPVLIIHNRTLNYSFEIDINDFANCWYIHVKDSNSDYEIELGRRGINEYIDIPNNYLFISNSNEIEAPNDHILFEKLPDHVLFKNVKTNETIEKAIFYYLAKIKSSYNIKDFYKFMYNDEDFDFDKLTLKNPSSSSPTY